jgi:uncharacterized protein (TIGR00299 family) protein
MSRRSSTAPNAKLRAAGARLLHLDTFSGISGNMFLGALLDAGLALRELAAALRGLGVAHELRVTRVRRGALAARYVEVLAPGQKRRRKLEAGVFRRAAAPARRAHAAAHAHGHSHSHDSPHDHAVHAEHRHDHSQGRPYSEIAQILRRARIPSRARERAREIFDGLARAEARVHAIPIARVHFHEVGMVDAIVDIAGAAIALELLGVGRVTASPPALGHGHVHTAHGLLPVPAPATLELLRGIPTQPAHVEWETVTPTGAAILRVIADDYLALPAMTVEAVGYGAGNDRAEGLPNVLRAVLGREAGWQRDRISVLETQLDDLVPEHFDFLRESLFEAGALDVSLAHRQMKKNRPGFEVRVLAKPSDRFTLSRILFGQSSAIGVRIGDAERLILRRESRRVSTRYGAIRVKLVTDPEGGVGASAEYDDCKRAARKHGVDLRRVVREAEALAESQR